MYHTTDYDAPIGKLTLASTEDELIGLWVKGQKYFGSLIQEKSVSPVTVQALEDAKSWLDRYFEGKKPDPRELPLAFMGSSFRQEVWRILCEIPYGEVTTYGAIARDIAQSRGQERFSSQAVGGAVGHNPISIIVPCHRVVGSNGSLTGYAGGLPVKIALLEHEQVDTDRFFVPAKGTAR